ncbi:unnamed protein product [Thlaspi arvense]|uniref:Sugar phosphate transporter domain-containing protein n=1 Tax=Thlaspi arvense TaxID=13288 RepID=A0AAU9SKE2_THLAR|nr:unnamed protein product [Thlaspi arvense]
MFACSMLKVGGSEALVANENSDKSISPDLASSPSKRHRIDITDSTASDKSSIQQQRIASSSSTRWLLLIPTVRRSMKIYTAGSFMYGREMMRRLFASNVLIFGMNGLGAEIGMRFSMMVSRLTDGPKTELDFWKTLTVAGAHTIGHVAATVSMSKVAVSFTHIIKSGEPAFSILVSSFFLGDTFPLPVYLSLLPIIGGCALAAVTELNFNMIGKAVRRCGFHRGVRCTEITESRGHDKKNIPVKIS